MEVIFHAHHAEISERMRQRARRAVEKVAARLDRAVDAIIRFEQDGPAKRVEVVLHAPRHRQLVAVAEDRFFGNALAEVVARLQRQIASVKRTPKARGEAVRALGRA